MQILLKIWLALFFSVLATVAYAENSRTWTPLGGDTGPAHSAGRKLASSPADDFALVDISSTISTDFKFFGAVASSSSGGGSFGGGALVNYKSLPALERYREVVDVGVFPSLYSPRNYDDPILRKPSFTNKYQ